MRTHDKNERARRFRRPTSQFLCIRRVCLVVLLYVLCVLLRTYVQYCIFYIAVYMYVPCVLLRTVVYFMIKPKTTVIIGDSSTRLELTNNTRNDFLALMYRERLGSWWGPIRNGSSVVRWN
jgi:hypothetical protein